MAGQDTQQGLFSALNLTTATVLKTGGGRVARVIVNTAGAAGTLSDCSTTGAVAAANLIAVIPATAGVYYLDFPYSVGLTYTPGANQVASISYS